MILFTGRVVTGFHFEKIEYESAFFWCCTLIFTCIAAYLTYIATSSLGIGISPDSVEYLRLARDITDNSLKFLFKDTAVSQPPLYPAALALISFLTGVNLDSAARIMNIVSFSGIVVLTMIGVRRVTSYWPITLAIGLLTCFSVPLFHVSTMAWTEPFFILVVYSLLIVISSPNFSLTSVLVAGFLAGAACLIRYAGVVLIPVIFIFILLYGSKEGIRNNLKHACLFVFISSLVFVPYIIRNIIICGFPLGHRVASQTSFINNLLLTSDTFSSWFFPQSIKGLYIAILFVFISTIIVLGANRRRIARVILQAHYLVHLSALFLLFYTGFIVWTSTTTAYDPIDTRLLSSVYPALLIVFSFLLKPEIMGSPKRSLVAICVFALFFIVSPCVIVGKSVDKKISHGAGGYNTIRWHQSELFDYLSKIPNIDDEVLYSNVPDAVYFFTHRNAKMSPGKRYYNSRVSTGVTSNNLFETYPDFNNSILVWSTLTKRDYLYQIVELRLMSKVRLIKEFPDSAVYRVTSLTP